MRTSLPLFRGWRFGTAPEEFDVVPLIWALSDPLQIGDATRLTSDGTAAAPDAEPSWTFSSATIGAGISVRAGHDRALRFTAAVGRTTVSTLRPRPR
jgi:hypothetical protein